MDIGLAGRKVLVIGGTKGIGRAIVELFVAEGAQVALCARNPEDVAAKVAASNEGRTLFGAAVDVAAGPAVAAWVADPAHGPARGGGPRGRLHRQPGGEFHRRRQSSR